ncbi:MAG: DeoR/GlpR family DNA-binding transcription regulator [Rhodospirillaceae bacterium]
MDQFERQAKIMAQARIEGRVSVDMLAETFSVTTQTIRRDLAELSRSGQLSRVHGGAVLTSGVANVDYGERRQLDLEEKRAIGLHAASMIPNGCSVTLNIGTTTEQVAHALRDHVDLVVVTNNIHVVTTLSGTAKKEIVLAGGQVRQLDGAIVGQDAVEFISRFKTDIAIIGASALDEDGAVTDFDMREVAVARAIVANARQRILVCDRSKFDRTAPVRICSLDDIDIFVTDRPPPERFARACAAADVIIEVAPPLSSFTTASPSAASLPGMQNGGQMGGQVNAPAHAQVNAQEAGARVASPAASPLLTPNPVKGVSG